jgi:uncharacterized membrane protein SpoIIM required for sporulation
MGQSDFVERHASTWERFERRLDACELDGATETDLDDLPELYRTVCRHLALARRRNYSSEVVRRLNPLVRRGHALLYGAETDRWEEVARYLAGGLAHEVRRDWPLLLLATLLFVGPAIAVVVWLQIEPEWAHHVLGSEQAVKLQAMYESVDAMQAERQADSDVYMFGFYIYNNIGIALRTFGSGLIAGIGAMAALVYNGVHLGAAGGFLQHVGLGSNFWPFVVGHGAFELTAIVLAGQAGLKIGFAPIWPGRRSRLDALRRAGRVGVRIVGGAFVMLVIAAFIEAFWSSAPLLRSVKYTVGGLLWVAVFAYFALAGRGAR